MTGLRVVPAGNGTPRVSVFARMQHLCPFVNEVDDGGVTIEWQTEGSTIELHSLRAYLDTYAEVTDSHEAITESIRADLDALDGIRITAVVTRWTTAGMEVACSTSPTPAHRQ